jgi:signal peptidase I
LWATTGTDEFLVTISPRDGNVELLHNGRPVRRGNTATPLFDETWRLEFSLIDQQALLAFEGQLVLEPYAFQPAANLRPSSRPFAIGAQRLGLELAALRIHRDIYYTSPLGLRQMWGIDRPCQLPDDEYFVLGDNSPVSEDSRLWPAGPGVKRELLIGKPFAAQGSRPALGRLHLPAVERIRWIE